MKRKLVLGCILALSLMVFVGCGNNADKESVTTAGSTSVQPLSEVLAESFMNENEDIKVMVQGGGSGQGIKSVEEKIADIGALSRNVKDEEKDKVVKEYKIAMDGIGVIVNKEVGIDNLKLEQVRDIFNGKITNWKDVGGQDKKIQVVSREEGSGTRGAFVEITKVLKDDKDMTTKEAIVQPSTGAAKKTVANTPNSIAYVSLESVDENVKLVKIDGVDASNETVIDGTYKISRPFLYVVGDNVSKTTQKYLDFVLSEKGQKVVEDAGFIPVR